MGIVSSAMAGFGEGLQQAGKMFYAGALKEELDAAKVAREQRLIELREEAEIRAEKRKREPYQRAAQRGEEAVRGATRFDEDAAGNVSRTDPGAAEAARLRAGAYDAEGLAEAGSKLRSEALTAERIDLERGNLDRRDRQDQAQHAERMAGLNRQLAIAEKQLTRSYKLDANQSTALTTNIKFMVESGIAPSPTEAFTMLRTGIERSPDRIIEQMTMQFLKSGDRRYRGADGQKLAADDARALIGRIRASDDEHFSAGFDRVAPLGAKRQGQQHRSLTPGTRRPMDAFLLGEEE